MNSKAEDLVWEEVENDFKDKVMFLGRNIAEELGGNLWVEEGDPDWERVRGEEDVGIRNSDAEITPIEVSTEVSIRENCVLRLVDKYIVTIYKEWNEDDEEWDDLDSYVEFDEGKTYLDVENDETVQFNSIEDAEAYCQKHGIDWEDTNDLNNNKKEESE